MEVVILVFVVIAVLASIVSGIWVAIALVNAVSTHRRAPAARLRADKKDITQDIQ